MRICSGPGCLRVVADDIRYCDECRPIVQAADGIKVHGFGYTPELDKLRKSTRWTKLRAMVVRSQPLCRRCRLRSTAEADHIVPAQEAIAQAQVSGKFLDKYAGYFFRSNLQGLCRMCHARKTLEDKAHSGPWPDVVTRETERRRTYTF